VYVGFLCCKHTDAFAHEFIGYGNHVKHVWVKGTSVFGDHMEVVPGAFKDGDITPGMIRFFRLKCLPE